MRSAFLIAGLAVLALIWGGPLLGTDRASFAAHMIAHMGVVALTAPLLALGLPGMPALLGPGVATVVEFLLVWGWHAPALRAAAETSLPATVAEQASFLAAGFLLWHACLRAGGLAGAVGLLFTSMHMTLLGALLALAPRPLYGTASVTCLGLTLGPGADQNFGGTVMLAVGALAYLAGGLALMTRMLEPGR
ncbi:cytochrome c oxidase assembly protein [Amaricoccus solimangrovi]|nr:cytochrome c oxidase assembly protein [Amaricoccus solimangrovi]